MQEIATHKSDNPEKCCESSGDLLFPNFNPILQVGYETENGDSIVLFQASDPIVFLDVIQIVLNRIDFFLKDFSVQFYLLQQEILRPCSFLSVLEISFRSYRVSRSFASVRILASDSLKWYCQSGGEGRIGSGSRNRDRRRCIICKIMNKYKIIL